MTAKTQLIVLTGGPGAGKSATLEVVQKVFAGRVAVVREAASLLYGGGFPRLASLAGKKSTQRAIYYVQRELERIAAGESNLPFALCDRGSLDGLAYWPDCAGEFWRELATTEAGELARYAAVIHLHTPKPNNGYNHQNALRLESASEAQAIDARIEAAWAGHPRRYVVPESASFIDKVSGTLAILARLLDEIAPAHGDAPINGSA